MKFREIFEDTEGGASSKRVAFFIFILLFVLLTLALVLLHLEKETLGYVQTAQDKVAELVKWLGGFILADKTPAAVRAFTGNPEPKAQP